MNSTGYHSRMISTGYHSVSLGRMVLVIILSSMVLVIILLVYDEWYWLVCESRGNSTGYYSVIYGTDCHCVSLWWMVLVIIMSVYDEWSWLLLCQSVMNGPGYYYVSLQWTIQTIMFDVCVCIFCFIFVYGLLLQICRFLTQESVCIREEFWNAYLLITKFDCPHVTLCSWQDVKIQLQTK